jgi:excinuclease UvrABC nuclease subunit
LSGKLLVATCELSRLHVIFEHANACLRIFELRTGNLIEKDNMFKTDNA